jgi:hypothetical protein
MGNVSLSAPKLAQGIKLITVAMARRRRRRSEGEEII